jgi:bifunctional non-homologous end joining protein LigD
MKRRSRVGGETIKGRRPKTPKPTRRNAPKVKFKAMNEQEVVIVGYTAPRCSRKYFGALVLAVRIDSTWRCVGRAGNGL